MGHEPAEPSSTAVTAATTTAGTTTAGIDDDLGAGIDAAAIDSEPPGPLAEDSALLPCSWCGATVPDVVPLVAGRAGRRRVVAAICPRCVDNERTSGALSPLVVVAFGALALASLWVWSMPGRPSSRTTAAIAIGWVAAVAAYGFQATRAALAARHGAGASGSLRSWRWAVPPLLGLFVAVAVLLALPLRGRFALSRAAITSAADDAPPGVGRHGRLVAYPGGLLHRIDGSTGVLVDARCGFFRTEAPDTSSDGSSDGSTGAGSGATAGDAAGVAAGTGSAAGGHVVVDAVGLGGGWRAGCLTAPVDAAAPAS